MNLRGIKDIGVGVFFLLFGFVFWRMLWIYPQMGEGAIFWCAYGAPFIMLIGVFAITVGLYELVRGEK